MTESRAHRPMASKPALGGLIAILLFIFALAAFVIQSSLTQYVQGTLGFRQPFFLLYIGHCSFMLIFPMHMLYLVLTSRRPIKFYASTLKAALINRISPKDANHHSEKAQFPTTRFFVLALALATGINVPGLLWYASISLSSIGDVTALWNTNSFWVYVLTVWLYRMEWEARKLGAVLLASIGVMLDVYGGSKSNIPGVDALDTRRKGPTAPVIGDVLTLVASISYALYQVLYKRYAALPNDSEEHDEDDDGSVTPFAYESLSEASDSRPSLVAGRHQSTEDEEAEKPPFGLYANFLTSCMGACTALSLAIGFPVLHWLSVERFRLPPDSTTFWSVVAIALSGVFFNSCFMILLGVWGPVLTSVGNLLTIVLVLIADVIFSHGSITIWSLLGSGMIVAAFGVLVLDMIHRPK